MKKTLEDPKYADLELVKVAYGDDLRDKSVSETEALLQTYPDLKCIVAPTTVGIAAAAGIVNFVVLTSAASATMTKKTPLTPMSA